MSALFRSSASAHTFTTWRNWHEWSECRQHFDASFDHSSPSGVSNSSSDADRSDRTEHGLRVIDIVNAWRSRGRLPLAVESTAQLIQLNIKYQFPANTYIASSNQSTLTNSAASSSSSDSTLQARLQYSMALLRLVNGILDPMQAKQYAQSVSSLAKQMHLPRILVDIRHESTHQSLPSLPLLQLASISALQWLSKHYWSAQSHALTRLDETIKHRLRDYKKHKSAADAKRKAAREAATAVEEGDEEAGNNDEDAETKTKQDQQADVASGDQILFSVDPSVQAASSVPEKALDALKELFSAMSSGNTLQHTHQLVETKLLPLLLSDVALIKPPKQARVSLTSVFRKLVDTWEPALNFLSYKWRSQNLHLTQLLFKVIVQQLAVSSNGNVARESDSAVSAEKNEQIWRKDLLREWGLHLLKTQSTTLFREETPASISASAAVVAALSDKETNNKKRSHGAMQDGASAPPMPVLDEVLYTCMKSLNPYLASFLPLLVPIFKQSAQSRKDVNTKAITKIELLLHVVTKSLYPQHRIATPANVQLTIPQLNDNLVQKAQEFVGKQHTTTITAAKPSSQVPSSSIASAPRKFFRVKRAVPSFLPLGMLEEGSEDSLWLQDETWTVRSAVAVAVTETPAALFVPAISEDAGDAMEVDTDEKEEKRGGIEASPAKRSKVSATPSSIASKPDKAQLAHQKAAQQDAIKQLQQAIVWM